MKHVFFCITLLFATLVSAQKQPEIVKGKVAADLSHLDGIYVINVNTEKGTATREGGYFEVAAAVGDTLMFSSTQTIGNRIVITEEDLNSELVFVRLQVLVHHLDEVIVRNHPKITSESLGLVPSGQKVFTPAERKLNTASNPYAQIGLNSAASLDPVLNWMSGRTAMLRKEVEIEKKEGWLEVLADLYSSEYIEKLKIPAPYVEGFYRYCVENTAILASLKGNNKTMAAFQLAELAVKYNEIISLESK
ncbi:MAG TPA: hypothetical protein VF676_05460 [Flavobacterium sp.]|jgi:hypothetical protein